VVRRNVDEILKKYGARISGEMNESEMTGVDVSKDYSNFKKEMMPNLSRYESWVRGFSFLNINLSPKDRDRISEQLKVAHLDLLPSQVATAAFMGAFLTFLLGILIFVGAYFFQGTFTGPNGVFLFLMLMLSSFVFYYIYSSPKLTLKLFCIITRFN